MANNKKTTYMNVDQIRKQERENRFKNLKFDDDKVYSVDEIRQAAIDQGLIETPKPTVEPPTVNESGRQSAERRNPLDLRNMVQHTNNDTIPRIAQEAVRNYNTSRVGSDYLSKYDDSTRYTDVQNDIESLQNIRGGAKRRGRDTASYDRAIEMLKSYASQNYSLDDTSLSLEDRNAIYKQNKQDIADLSGEGNDEYTRDYSLMRWLGMYDKNAVSSDEENQTAIDLINKDNVKYDVSLDVGGLSDEEKKQKAEELRTYFQDKYGYGFNTDYLTAASEFYKSKKSRYDNAKVDNEAYERLGQASAVTIDINKKDDYEQNSVAGDYGTPTSREEVNEYITNANNARIAAIDDPTQKLLEQSANRSNDLPDKLGSFFAVEKEEIAETPNTYVQLRKDYAGSGFAVDTYDRTPYTMLQTEGYKNHWDVMTNEEVGAYYYLLNTEGKDAAYEYLDSLANTLQKRANYENKKTEMEISGEEGTITNLDWLVRNASTVPDKVAGGIAGYIDNVSHYIAGEDIEPYSNIHGASLSATATREAAGETLDKKTGAEDANRWAVKPSQLYQGVMSAADMATAMIVGPEVYGASMGMSAAEDTARDLWEQGEDNDTINALSTAAGTAEMLFEELSLDKIIKISNLAGESTAKGLVKNYLLNMVKSSGIEASEEVLTEAANMVVDYAVRGDRSDESGYSFEDVANRLYQAGVGGAIGGLLGGGGATTLSATAKGAELIQNQSDRNKYIAAVGSKVVGAGNTQELIDQAKAVEGDSKAAQRIRNKAEKLEQRTEKSGNTKKTFNETGKLYTSMQENNISRVASAEETEIKTALSKAYAEKIKAGVNDKSVSKVVNALYKSEYTDEPLTMSERRIVNNNQKAKAALSDVQSNEDVIRSQINRAQRRATEDMTSTAALTGTKEQATEKPAKIDIDDFNLSDDGKTYTADGGEQVDIKSISSVDADDIRVELSNGKTESVKALDLGSEDQAVVYQGIMDMQTRLGAPVTASFANAVVNEYNQAKASDANLSTTDFIYGVEEAVRKGYMNDNGGNYAVNLSESAREALFDEGRKIAQEHTKAQQKSVQNRIKGDNSQRKGTVTYEDGIERSQLNERQQVGVDVVTHIAEETEIDVVFFRSTKDGKGRYSSNFITKNSFSENGQAPNGFWHNGKMYIDVNAGMNGEGLILFTAAHEIVHMIREGSPESFKALADFLVENYAKKGVDVNKLVLKEMTRSTNLNYDQAFEEVIAQSCESFLRDIHLSDKAEQLYKTDKGLATKIKNILNRILNALKKWYGVAKPQSVEANYVLEMKDALSEAYDKYIAGIRAASENLRNMEKSADKGGTKLQARYSETADILNDFNIPENKMSDYVYVQRNVYNTLLKDGFFDKSETVGSNIRKFRTDVNAETGMVIETGRKGIKETFSFNNYAKLSKQLKLQKLAVIRSLPEIIQNGRMIADDVVNYHNDESGVSFAYILADIEVNGGQTTVKVAVRKSPQRNSFWVHSIEAKEKSTELDPSGATPDLGYKSLSAENNVPQSADKVKRQSRSDADYLSAVKHGDMKTAQRMVDEAAKAAGYDRHLYHGSKAGGGFTVFKGWQYFTASKAYAERYTQRETGKGLYDVYVKSDRLFDTRKADDRAIFGEYKNEYGMGELQENGLPDWTDGYDLSEIIEENELDYDGIVLDEGGDLVDGKPVSRGLSYVIRDSSQVKSADPVTYDDNGDVIPLSERFNESNKDIRFSLRDNVEETRDLIAVHNLTEEKLLKSLRLGGLPMPSVAVIKAENGHKGYGDISIVFPKETIDPSENRNNKLYGGDVWSPTYPSIDYEVDTKKANKIYTRAREALRKPAAYRLNPVTFHPENIADRINSYGGEQGFIEHYKNDYGMKQFYLAEQDQAVSERYVEKRNEISDVDKEFFSFIADQLGKEAFSQEATKTGREWNNRYADDLDNARIDYMRSVYGELSKEEEENLRRDFESERPVHKFRIAMSVQGYLENGGVTVERKLDEDGIKADIDKLVDQSKYEEWLKELFNGIEKSSGIYNGTDYYTSSGNRRSFAQTHYTETLANVVRVMKSQDNGDSFFGGNGLWAIAAKNYGTIEEMKADKERLTNLSDEERQEISNRFGERFTEIASSIANDGDNEFLALDNAYGNICDAVRNTNTKSGLLRELQKYHHKATVATVDDILDLVSDVGNMPVNYFEAKPQRAIKFNEVSTAVIPDNASQALRTELDKAGVKYVEYASGNEEARTEILNSLEDVKFQSRDNDLYFGETDDAFDIDFGEDDSVENLIAREFVTHHEDMGEVLQNVADIELTPKKVESIVNRVIRNNLGRLEEESRHTLSIELQMALERVNVDDPQTVSDNIIGAVRKAIEGSTVVDDKAVSDYNQLRDAFKGKKFYLTDEQINQLKEHNMTLDSYRRAMSGKVTIVKRENAKRSINGGYADAHELSLESLHDILESPDEVLGFRSWEWDEKGYDAPNIIKKAFETLRDRREQPITNVYSDEAIDERAVAIAAKITGGIVEAKYNSKQNPYVTKLVADLKQKRTEAVNKQKEKNRQKLAELKQKERERAEKREQEIRAKYREQRAKGYENRKRTEFRGKVKQLIGSFNTMLTHPVEGKYIPRGFVSQTIDILNAINTDSRRSERLSAAIADLKVKYEGLKADETGYASYNSAMEDRLRILSEMIEAEAEEWVPKRNKAIAYENKRAATERKPLKRPVTTADFSIQNMSLELLQYTYETLNGMRTVIRESMRMTGEETRKMRQQITDALISEIKGVRREHTNMLAVYGNLSKSGYVMFKSFADYKKNSEWENRQNELNKGQLETSRLLIEFSKPTLELIADKKNLDNMLHTKVDIGLKDADGNPVLVTHDMLVHIYLDLANEHNAGHVAGDGYHVPDLDLYYEGKRAKSFEVANSRLASGPYIHAVELSQRMKELDIRLNTALTNGEDTLSIENEIDKTAAEIKKLKAESDKYLSGLKQAVESKMTAYDYQWVEVWREFNDMASSAINNVTMQTLGFKKAVVDNYFPITVDKSFRAPDFDTIVSDMSLESWGSLKERVKGAKGAIVLQGITDVMADRIHKTALYCGMTIPVQNFRKVYGGTQYNFAEKKEGDDFKTSVQRELDKKFGTPTVGDSANVYIKKLVADLIESRNNSDNGSDKLLALARGGIAISTLTTNPRVWLVQAASLVSALPELDIKSVLKGTATIAYKWNPHYKQKGAATRLRMSKVTPLYDLRRMGMVDTELGDIAKQRSSKVSKAAAFSQKILNLTQKVDSLTTGRIWFMCEYWVKDHKPSLREGTIEFDKAVAEKYNQVIERTQPNYTPMQRGQILRSKNAVTKLFTMWQTQRMQNVNMLFDAVGTLNRTIYDYNHGLNNITKSDLKTAWFQTGKTTLAFLVSNAMIVAIQAATDILIYRKFKRYADDDDELTTQSVLYGIFLNYLSTLTGNFFGGSELEDMISAFITGERYNEINPGLLGTLIEDVTSVVKTAQALKSDGVLSADFLTNLNTAITNWCGVFGIPARNIEKIYDGAVGWIEKLVDKDLFQFSEIGSHVNKALNARAVNKIVKGDYSSVSVMTQDKYDEAYTKAWNKGKSEEDCQSAGRTAAKKAIANLVKETYLSTDDFETKRTIRLYMYKSGYYVVSSGKNKGQVSLDVVDKTLESWKNNQDEKDSEAETAKQRKGK